VHRLALEITQNGFEDWRTKHNECIVAGSGPASEAQILMAKVAQQLDINVTIRRLS
jgi:hypothetical protein